MMATRNDLCSSLYFQKTLGNYLKCKQKFGEYQLNRFRHIQQKFSESRRGGGVILLPPTQILISLNVEIRILQPLQPALHLSQP